MDLSAWLSLAGIIVSTIIAPLIITMVTRSNNKKDEWAKHELLKLQENRRKEMTKIIATGLKPVEDRIEHIEEEMSMGKEVNITNLRATMKSLRDRYMKQGFADVGDKATWLELYNDYKKLGGNHFKEYVDLWLQDVQSLETISYADAEKRGLIKK